jgi:catechol 2,3-dioxygenase-like lactoylglutathione lyase family enzyme
MTKVKAINHVTLIVDQLEEAVAFYQQELGMEVIPAFMLDYPTAFLQIGKDQQLHLTEWEDAKSFRGHVCLVVDDFNAVFWRSKELGIIDQEPWGKVRQLPEGVMQMFIRDPSGNLIEISSMPGYEIDPAIFKDEMYKEGLYISGRNDFRGFKSEDASLHAAGKN